MQLVAAPARSTRASRGAARNRLNYSRYVRVAAASADRDVGLAADTNQAREHRASARLGCGRGRYAAVDAARERRSAIATARSVGVGGRGPLAAAPPAFPRAEHVRNAEKQEQRPGGGDGGAHQARERPSLIKLNVAGQH